MDVDSAGFRCEHSLGRSKRTGRAEFHGRVRRRRLSGHRGDGTPRGFRLVRVSRAELFGGSARLDARSVILSPTSLALLRGASDVGLGMTILARHALMVVLRP